MIMILAGNDRKKARGALIVMLMLVSSALVLVNVSSASAALPWGRPGAPEWEEPEEVRPYVRGPDEIAPTIRLQLRFEKGDAPGDWNEITPEVQSEDGKNLNIYRLSWSDYGDKPGKMEIYAYVTDGIQELSDGIVKGSAQVTIRGDYHYMGEYASTADNPVEAKFVYYHDLHAGYTFRVYMTVEDNAGNLADTRDAILYQIEVQSAPKPPPPAKTKDELTGGKSGPWGKTYDPYRPEKATELEAYWYSYTSNNYFHPNRGDKVGALKNRKLRGEAWDKYWDGKHLAERDNLYREYWERNSRVYKYYTQDGTHVYTYTTSASGL